MQGTISTNYVDGTSIQFNGGSNSIFGVNAGAYIPNEALWDPNGSDPNTHQPTGAYTGIYPPAPAMWAGSAYVKEISAWAAYFAMKNVHFDLASSTLPISGMSFDPSSSQFGATQLDFLMKSQLPAFVGDQYSPNEDPNANPNNDSPPPSFYATDTLTSASITAAGDSRTLTYPFSMPITFYVAGVPFQGTMNGQIVATTAVPEPSSVALGVVGLASLSIFVGLRRRRLA